MIPSRLQMIQLVFSILLLAVPAGPGRAQGSSDAAPPIEFYSSFSTPQVEALSHSGAAVTSIPVLVPPGRAGLAPSLSLTYNSYAKNGWVGVGFGLDLGAIQRSGKWGLDYQGREFSASLGGSAAELVPRPDWGGQMYGARLEAAFIKYFFKGAADGWEAWAKDGKRFYFGSTAASRQEDPVINSRVFKWCLDRVEDSNGNFMTVEYVKHRGEIYPRRVNYTGNRGLSPINAVIFHLEDRPDAGPMFGTGFEVTTAKRLKTIEVRAGSLLVRAYAFDYTEGESTGRSLLSSVQQFGTDARIDAAGEIMAGSSLPPTRLDWQEDSPGSFSRPPAAGSVIQSFDFGGNRDQVIPFDFNGDGNMDLFMCRPEWGLASVLRSNGDGSFTQAYWSTTGIGGYNLRNQEDKALVFDFDGDGKSDLFFYRPDTGNAGIARSNGDGSFNKVYLSENGIGGYDFKSLRDRALSFDFNGDGKSDLLFYRPGSGKIFVLRSNGDGSFTTVTSSWSGIAGYDLNSEADRVFAFDFDGDGRNDLFLYRTDHGKVTVARSNGDGTFTPVYSSGYGIAGYDLRGRRDVAFPFDFNGDGKTDLFLYRPDSGLACVARSNGDGTFTQVYYSAGGIGGYDLRGKRDMAFPFDFNGDGNADIFFFRQEGRTASVVQSGVAVPDLLTRVENPLGGVTEIAYTSSSRCQNHLLPFIVHPVSAISIKDGLAGSPALVTRFAYSGGYYDYGQRDFRGFETISQTNPEGATTTTVFHQDTHRQGKSRLVETRESAAGPLMARSEFVWEQTQLRGSGAYFVKLLSKQSAVYDTEAVFSGQEYFYDDETGNLLETTVGGTGAESVTTSTVWESFGAWLFRPTRETLEGSVSGKLRESYLDYEPRTGNLRTRELWLEGGANPRLEMAYDACGNPVAAIDALGHVTVTDYDAETRTFPVWVKLPKTGPVEHIKHMEVDPRFGKPSAATDENGNRTLYAYDDFGRLVETRFADGGVTRVEYQDRQLPACVLTSVKEAAGGGWIRSYQYMDGLGRGIQTVGFGEGGNSIVTRSFYDAMGRNHYRAGPYFAAGAGYPQAVPNGCPWAKTSFDRRGRPVRIETPDAEHGTVAAVFAYNGLTATATDPDGAGKTERNDYLGRVVEVIEHNEGADAVTTYKYNAAGDLLSVTNALGQAVTMAYDTLGRKTGMNDPDMGAWGYVYDSAGRLTAQTDAKGQATRFAYDALGRVLSKTYSTPDPAVTYAYDDPGVANGIGRLHEVKNANAATTYKAYDARGRVLEVGRSIRGAPKSIYNTVYRYDLAGRLVSMLYPDNYQVAYGYHPETGLLKSVVGVTDFTEYAEFESYDAAGRAQYVYHGNGTATTHSFDAASGRLTSIATADPNLAQLQKKSYRYSSAGDIVGITDASAKGSFSRSYQYDRRHRLLAETSVGAEESFKAAVITPVFDDRFPLHGPKIVAVAGVEHRIGYDENGNMVRLPDLSDPNRVRERHIAYNADNLPVRIAYAGESGAGGSAGAGGGGDRGCFIGSAHAQSHAPATVELLYDGAARRVIKRVHGTRLTFYIGGHFEVVDGIETKHIFAGAVRIAKISSGSPHFYHKDHLGSSTFITDSENGLPVETADFLPFGLMRTHSGENIARHKYTDQEEDTETGLYNYNARLYDPAIGMFISPDTIVQNPFDPQTLNRYAYARNNPLTFTDPSGHFVQVVLAGIAVGAAVGAISSGIQNDWALKETLIGAGIGGVAGGVGAGVGGLAFSAAGGTNGGLTACLAGGIAGGVSAGATSGGLSAAVYGGSVSEGMLTGAKWGAIGGAAFGAVGWGFDGAWPWYRIPTHVAAGGSLAALSGDNVIEASSFALATSVSAYLFYNAQGENPNPEPGKEMVFKKEGDRAVQMNQNVGMARSSVEGDIFLSEHDPILITIGKFPLMNAMGTWHDNWPIDYSIPKPAWDYFAKFAPGHAVALTATFMAHYAATNPAYYGRLR